ncbi:MAG TPA: ABC transporter substrate-binding protein [Chloroflexota bacterium]
MHRDWAAEEHMTGGTDSFTRRRFVQTVGLTGLGLLAGCRLPWQIQPPARIARVGYLSPESPPPPNLQALQQGLRELGYVQDRNLVLEVRMGTVERFPALAAELVAVPVDVLIAATATIAVAAKRVTSSIPIVFIESSDPIGQGLVLSLPRPGGNATGLSHLNSVLVSKQLELLKDAVPSISRVGLLRNANIPLESPGDIDGAAQTLDLQLESIEVYGVSGAGDLEASLAGIATPPVDGLVALPSLISVRERIAALAGEMRLPLISAARAWSETGALMSYGPNVPALYRRAAHYVDRILKGTRPTELPVEQPREFEFVINLKTAQALGLTIPQHVLLQATEIIQ